MPDSFCRVVVRLIDFSRRLRKASSPFSSLSRLPVLASPPPRRASFVPAAQARSLLSQAKPSQANLLSQAAELNAKPKLLIRAAKLSAKPSCHAELPSQSAKPIRQSIRQANPPS
jgi:hypothetical protein